MGKKQIRMWRSAALPLFTNTHTRAHEKERKTMQMNLPAEAVCALLALFFLPVHWDVAPTVLLCAMPLLSTALFVSSPGSPTARALTVASFVAVKAREVWLVGWEVWQTGAPSYAASNVVLAILLAHWCLVPFFWVHKRHRRLIVCATLLQMGVAFNIFINTAHEITEALAKRA